MRAARGAGSSLQAVEVVDVDAIDLHYTRRSRPERSAARQPFPQRRGGQRHEVCEEPPTSTPRPRPQRHTHRSTKFPLRAVEQHQLQRPLAQPVLRNCLLPTRRHQLTAGKIAHRGCSMSIRPEKGACPPPIAVAVLHCANWRWKLAFSGSVICRRASPLQQHDRLNCQSPWTGPASACDMSYRGPQ
jgi:hypothetical protein